MNDFTIRVLSAINDSCLKRKNGIFFVKDRERLNTLITNHLRYGVQMYCQERFNKLNSDDVVVFKEVDSRESDYHERVANILSRLSSQIVASLPDHKSWWQLV